jgi:predicted nucleic acid-binding protein
MSFMSAERFTLDTNLLVYFHDFADPVKQGLASSIVRSAMLCECYLTLQSIGECFVSLRRALMTTNADAAKRTRFFATSFPLVDPTASALHEALSVAETGRFSFWDAFLLATAAEGGCTTCLSEDMDDGANLGKITVRHAFSGRGLSKAARGLLAT